MMCVQLPNPNAPLFRIIERLDREMTNVRPEVRAAVMPQLIQNAMMPVQKPGGLTWFDRFLIEWGF